MILNIFAAINQTRECLEWLLRSIFLKVLNIIVIKLCRLPVKYNGKKFYLAPRIGYSLSFSKSNVFPLT